MGNKFSETSAKRKVEHHINFVKKLNGSRLLDDEELIKIFEDVGQSLFNVFLEQILEKSLPLWEYKPKLLLGDEYVANIGISVDGHIVRNDKKFSDLEKKYGKINFKRENLSIMPGKEYMYAEKIHESKFPYAQVEFFGYRFYYVKKIADIATHFENVKSFCILQNLWLVSLQSSSRSSRPLSSEILFSKGNFLEAITSYKKQRRIFMLSVVNVEAVVSIILSYGGT